jgi:hypothetical protein
LNGINCLYRLFEGNFMAIAPALPVQPPAPSVARKSAAKGKPISKTAIAQPPLTAPTPASAKSARQVIGTAVNPAASRASKAATQPLKPAAEAKSIVSEAKPAKPKKPKLVRDSFTIPKDEYSVLEQLKLRASVNATAAKKSELLRAGIKALAGMSDAAFLAAVKAVPTIKTGRPKAPAMDAVQKH